MIPRVLCHAFAWMAVGMLPVAMGQVGPPSDVTPGEHMEALPPGELTNGKQSIEELGIFKSQASEFVALVQVETRPVALATVIAADGYFLTKASSVPDEGVPRIQIGEAASLEAEVVEHFKELDLLLLKVPVSQLARPQWREPIPPAATWLLTPIFRNVPALLGVISAKTRKIERPPAAIGIFMSDEGEVIGGVEIGEVFPGSAGDDAGLLHGDIIETLNGTPIFKLREVRDAVRSHAPGDTITLGIVREEKEAFEVEVVLGDSVSTFYEFNFSERNRMMSGQTSTRKTGFPLVLQHDTPLRPREMGGPLLDLDGRVVGINIARFDRVTCFALPCKIFLPSIRKAIEAHRSTADTEENSNPESEESP